MKIESSKSPKVFLIAMIPVIVFFARCDTDEPVKVTPIDTYFLKITVPEHDLSFVFPGAPILFKGTLVDGNPQITESKKLKLLWVSDRDGVLQEGSLDDPGIMEFSTRTLSRNLHKITLKLQNEIGDSLVSNSVMISNVIGLFPLKKNRSSIVVRWSSWKSNDFSSYRVYRHRSGLNVDEGEMVFETNHSSDTSFVDSTAHLGDRNYYQVYGVYNSGLTAGSNVRSMGAGFCIEAVDFPILKVIADPKRDFAYGIVSPSSIYDDNKTGYGLVFIDTRNFGVTKRILTTVQFSDLDLDIEGDYLYLACRNTLVYKIDLETQELKQTITLSHSAHKIEIGSNDRLIYHVTPPTSGSTEFRIYDLATNTDIPDKRPNNWPLSVSHGDFELNTVTNEIIHGESNNSSSNISLISTKRDSLSMIGYWDSNRSGKDLLFYNADKDYIAWGYYLLDYDLNVLGTFGDESNGSEQVIYALSPSGTFALGWRSLFTTADRAKVKDIPISYTIATFVDDDLLLLCYTDSRIYQEYDTTVCFYSLE